MLSSPLFQQPDADVTISSVDNVNFYLHKKNLECNSEGFPPADVPTNGEIVSLSETAATLEILFQFIYPRLFPDLEKLDVKSLLLVAEAAEKYRVFAAMNSCQFALRKYAATHPKDILIFAAKYDYSALIVRLPQAYRIDTPLYELTDILPARIYRHWSLHRERWLHALSRATRLGPRHNDCSNGPHWILVVHTVLSEFKTPSSLLSPKLDKIFAGFKPSGGWGQCCIQAAEVWKMNIIADVATIPPFSIPDER